MALKIPSNQIKFNYTAGGEYIFKDTYRDYQGYYYETNGKAFAGKEFNQYAPELERVQIKEGNNRRFNPLLANAATFIYGKISKIVLPSDKINSIINKKYSESTNPTVKFFAKKVNSNPILIKEIDKNEYDRLAKNPLYQVISIEYPEGDYFVNPSTLDKAELEMPGIRSFILYDSPLD
jgi:hypothetical protein